MTDCKPQIDALLQAVCLLRGILIIKFIQMLKVCRCFRHFPSNYIRPLKDTKSTILENIFMCKHLSRN